MKWWVVIVVLLAIIGWGSWWIVTNTKPNTSPAEIITEITKPLDKYTIENLSNKVFEGSEIVFDETVETNEKDAYTVEKFHFMSDGRKVTGLAHIPIRGGVQSPVIIQLRGYVNPSVYESGIGTKRSAEVFAKNGFLSLAPDQLGYGESDSPSEDVFEERFQTYTTILNLLSSIKSQPLMDANRVGIWGHSNGGQQALTVLEITGKPYPTVLWAPVTKPFPYSILYYTDDIPDHGKALRKVTANFEKDYDVEKYSLTNYLNRIAAPIQIHQGGIDGTVPQKWSDDFSNELRTTNHELDYFVYPNAGHSMEGSWNTVVNRDIDFFKKHL